MLHLSNIGSNQTELTATGVKVLFSYQTPVAAWINGEYFKTDRMISKWKLNTSHTTYLMYFITMGGLHMSAFVRPITA